MLSVLQKQYQSIEVNNKNFQVKFKNSDKFGDFLIHLKEKWIKYKWIESTNFRKLGFKEINFKSFRLIFNYN